jgi:3-oxoacyl-[acyl-carrier protein] reductase
MRVVVGYNHSADAAHKLVATLAGAGHSARPAPVTDSGALTALAAGIAQDYGRCDALVNCAGITRFIPHGDLDALDDQLIDAILATNVRGAFATVRAFRSLLDNSPLPGGGVVVNVSSIAAEIAMGSNVIYCASKAALDNMTKSLARALASRIRVVSVSPGLVDTEFVKSLDQAWRDEQASRAPLGRLATPQMRLPRSPPSSPPLLAPQDPSLKWMAADAELTGRTPARPIKHHRIDAAKHPQPT